MREVEKLSNAEIAKKLDISPKTVYKYIGKQPAELNRPCVRRKKLPPVEVSLSDFGMMQYEQHKSLKERLEEERMRKIALTEPESPVTLDLKHEAMKEAEQLSKRIEELTEEALPLVMKNPVALTDSVPHEENKAETKRTSCMPELLAVFGGLAIREWLKVSMYVNMDIGSYCLTRDEMLKALETLNKTLHPEVINLD